MVNSENSIRKYCYIILLSLLYISCSRKLHNSIDVIDTKWKKEAMFNLSERYMRYKEKHDLEKKRHSEIDLFIKFDDINRYPFGNAFMKLQKEIESSKIKFDSIMCVGTQSSGSFDPEYLYPNYFYVFRNGKLIHVFIFDPYSFDLTSSDDTLSNLEEMYLTDNNKTDGDDLSLLIFTKIKPDWEFEINKFVINSY